MTWPDGREYFGQYVDNLKEGEGLFHWPDGRMYDGQWRKGLRNGTARFLDPDGIEYEGQWKKDRCGKKKVAMIPGVRDPFCEAPHNLLTLRPIFKKPKDRVDHVNRYDDLDSHHASLPIPSIPFDSRSTRPDPYGSLANSSGLSTSEIAFDIAQEDEMERDKGEAYVDYVPDDVNVIKIEGVPLPLYELGHLRRMPLRALRDHAEKMSDTFGESIGSLPPDNDQALIGWVYAAQARHLKPILELALKDVGGDLTEDVLVVSADSLSHLQGSPVTRETPNVPRGAAPETRGPQTGSETSTQFFRRDGNEMMTEDDISEDRSHIMVSEQTSPDKAASLSKRKRQRTFIDENVKQE
jgi:hypothetical protein